MGFWPPTRTMSTITINLPTVQGVTRALAGDWGPALRGGCYRVCAVLGWVIAAGVFTGDLWRQLRRWALPLQQLILQALEGCQLAALARLGLPGGSCPDFPDNCADHFVDANKMVALPCGPTRLVVQRQAPAGQPAPGLGVMPPRANAIEMFAADGMGQRKIAKLLGITRYQVRQVLKAAKE